jgi:uncharacterized protein (TIGR00290 family)
MAKRVVMSWSGGKDSSLALLQLLQDPSVEVVGLLTTVTETYERISMHGVRVDLLRRQAASIGLPLIEVWIPPGCTNELYEARMSNAYRNPLMMSAAAVASGDLFLEDVLANREEKIRAAGKEPLFPIWGQPTRELALSFIDLGFRGIVTCIDPNQVDPGICGREFDRDLLARLPEDVDPCGENGEFHTFVFAGPYLTEPIPIRRGEVVQRDGFVFADLVPLSSTAPLTDGEEHESETLPNSLHVLLR